MENKRNPVVITVPKPVSYIFDFEICADYEEVKNVLGYINRCGYDLVSVTQDSRDFFTLFFRRRANG